MPDPALGRAGVRLGLGHGSDDATVFVGLPAGRTYESPEMLIVVSPTLERMLDRAGPGRTYYAAPHRASARRHPAAAAGHDGRPRRRPAGGDLGPGLPADDPRRAAAPEAARLTDRIRGLVAELIAAQNEDGGWPWVARGRRGRTEPRSRGRATG